MSYNGTVRCGFCYMQGHNKRSCPELKKVMEQRLTNDPNDWQAKRWQEKREAQKARRSKPRKCSFCLELGHNRRSCGSLKNEMSEFTKINRKFREHILAEMRKHGLGVGALVCLNNQHYCRETWEYINNYPYLVKAIRWNSANVDEVASHNWEPAMLEACPVDDLTSMYYHKTLRVPRRPEIMTLETANTRLVSPVSGSLINPPEGWLDAGTDSSIRSRFREQELNEIWDPTECEYVKRKKSSLLEKAEEWAREVLEAE